MTVAVQQLWKPTAADIRLWGRPLWWTVSPLQELAVLFVPQRQLSHSSSTAGWLGWMSEVPFDSVLVIRHADGSVQHRTIKSIPLWPSHIALLPGDRLLIASGRVRKDEEGSWKPNALVYSPDGTVEKSFCIGDDIDVLVTAHDGSIWTAYGDEGIYGGHPKSAAGLAGWDSHGQISWEPDGRLPEWPLAGFSAATEGDQVWLAWYSRPSAGGTFLTRITPATGEVTSWPSPVESPDGVAVRGHHAILTRRVHNKNSTVVTRAELVDGSWATVERRIVEAPGPVVLRCGQGRDGVLWLRAGDAWVRIEA
ncbi:hypothetical protein [Polymorphospora rubra]|uniref:Uncharacterized protein n=1 Tax=Polymorphospora rubra TaxID=338584 RepID=A0A810NC52_9ACTN|nr:hypothetical protein [Polymorphospora rubra]BCJ69113.1 hypothetical protein Prubr_61340 [Polymorphospora rubra]